MEENKRIKSSHRYKKQRPTHQDTQKSHKDTVLQVAIYNKEDLVQTLT